MTPYARQRAAVDLAKRAAIFIHMNDPVFVSGGCALVSQTVATFLRHQGFKADVVFGFAPDPYGSGFSYEHVWLNVEGREIDLTWWVTRLIPTLRPRKHRRSITGWVPSSADVRGVEHLLHCPISLIKPMLIKLERAYEQQQLPQLHQVVWSRKPYKSGRRQHRGRWVVKR